MLIAVFLEFLCGTTDEWLDRLLPRIVHKNLQLAVRLTICLSLLGMSRGTIMVLQTELQI